MKHKVKLNLGGLIFLFYCFKSADFQAANFKPPLSAWCGKYNDGNNNRHYLGDWLLTGCWNTTDACKPDAEKVYEYEEYNGFYNNLARPYQGAIDGELLRRTPAAYKDGTYLPSGFNRPNPLELSESLLKGEIGTKSRTGKNAMLVFFGQQLVEEILDAQRPACPPEYFNIDIPENHTYRTDKPGHTKLPFLRTRYNQRTGYSPNNPRQQLNEITPYIDGGLVYGISKQWANQLRTYKNGTIAPDGCLASSHDGLFPAVNEDRLPMANPPPPFYHSAYIEQHQTAPVSRLFKLGNPRGNENAFLLTFGVVWFRWHNYLAKRLAHLNPDWTNEKIFNEARKWVIASQQRVAVYEWLPKLIPKSLPIYTKYDPSVDPQIDQFFQSAAFRFGHTLVPPGVYLRDYIRNGCKTRFNTWKRRAVRTCNIFWRPQEPLLTKSAENSSELIDIDRLLMGMALQLSEEEDNKIVEDLRGNVFGPLEFPRRDLMALNIQRARDHGLPDFNTARRAFGLRPKTFNDFKPESRETLRRLYKDPNNIDIWIGGILETGDGPGELFEAIILDQFKRIRDGDRFWFENKENKLFTAEEIQRIKSLNFFDILMAVTKMDQDDIQMDVFAVPNTKTGITSSGNLIANCALQESVYKNVTYYHLEQLNQVILNESCVKGVSYDYFRKSEISFILTFIGIGTAILGFFGFAYTLILAKDRQRKNAASDLRKGTNGVMNNKKSKVYPVLLWDSNSPLVQVELCIEELTKQLGVYRLGVITRAIDLGPANKFKFYLIRDQPYLAISNLHSYDLLVKFGSENERENFLKDLEAMVRKYDLQRENITVFTLKQFLRIITTKKQRQERIEKFYRVVFAQAFRITHSKSEIFSVDSSQKDLINTEITLNEFAESLNMKSDNDFVRKMFLLADKDRNGFMCFREFVDLLVIFADGSEEQKAHLLFKMYDIDNTDILKKEDFVTMIRSFQETCGGVINEDEMKKIIESMWRRAGLEGKTHFNFEDFKKILGRDINLLNKAKLGFQGLNDNSFLSNARDTIQSIYVSPTEVQARIQGKAVETYQSVANPIDMEQEKSIEQTEKKRTSHSVIIRFIEVKHRELFWFSLYTLVLLAIFAERAYYYSVEREHSGLRRIAGYGVTVTRGAASAMMFTYSSLLVTMCRNTITRLRETFLNKYFPFDASVEFHKYIAIWALIFTVMHIIGHAFNFYHISTQTADDLTCLFRNYFHATHELPKFHYWCWQTMTGFTGVIITLIWALMYIFAHSLVRRKAYNWFWYTHNMYPLFYIFMVLHGTGRLIQAPFLFYFFLGPVILFTLDTLVSVSRKKIEIPIIKAEALPSNVTLLEFKKPVNFQYKSGQWVRVASLALNKNEYHPFTLTSCPEEENLTLHIRAVGPWTKNIRRICEENLTTKTVQKLYLDGPYGEGHQDWDQYDVSILIGGGIGVTPFASILKDNISKSHKSKCKKIYFIWVSRTQKQFEWLIDIIREVENKDVAGRISCHIFITQFFEKFDLRMILLYVMERHYQRVSNKSLFTNLKAVTHFGRPNFARFFKTVQNLHGSALNIGVFSCGPPAMTTSVDKACAQINLQGLQKFEHHYNNF